MYFSGERYARAVENPEVVAAFWDFIENNCHKENSLLC